MALHQTQTFNISGDGTYPCAETTVILTWVSGRIFRLMDGAEVAAELTHDGSKWTLSLFPTTTLLPCLPGTATTYSTVDSSADDDPPTGSFGTWSTDTVVGNLTAGSGPSSSTGSLVPMGTSGSPLLFLF